MQVKLVTTDRGVAETLMLPLQHEVIRLGDGGPEMRIGWGEVEVERGAVETIFEILGSLTVSIGSGVLASWLWTHLREPGRVCVQIIRTRQGDTETIEIDTCSLEALNASLASALQPKPEHPEPEKVRILFLGANSAAQPLDLEREFRQIAMDLRMSRGRERLELKQCWAVTVDDLIQVMLDENPAIVHFGGHATAEGLMLRDEAGESRVVPIDGIARLFQAFSTAVQCVVLNACYSENQGKAIRRHIPHVVGTRATITDAVAKAFATGFYKAVGAGKDIPSAFEIGKTRVELDGVKPDDLLVLL
jgi:hypothetical protein